jgi:hypothetical protein
LKTTQSPNLGPIRKTFIPAENSDSGIGILSFAVGLIFVCLIFSAIWSHFFHRIPPKFSQIKTPLPLSVDVLQSLCLFAAGIECEKIGVFDSKQS